MNPNVTSGIWSVCTINPKHAATISPGHLNFDFMCGSCDLASVHRAITASANTMHCDGEDQLFDLSKKDGTHGRGFNFENRGGMCTQKQS